MEDFSRTSDIIERAAIVMMQLCLHLLYAKHYVRTLWDSAFLNWLSSAISAAGHVAFWLAKPRESLIVRRHIIHDVSIAVMSKSQDI